MRPISVNAVANGWVVTVGCQTFVYDDVAKLAADFQSYLTNPEETEKRIMASAVNARWTMGNAVPTPAVNQCAEAPRERMSIERYRDSGCDTAAPSRY